MPLRRSSFIFLCGALCFAALPLLGKLPLWAVAIFLVCLVIMSIATWKGRRVPSGVMKTVVLAGGVGGIMISYGTLFGVEAGTSVTLVLVSLKLLETRSARDVQVLCLLGYFICLSVLFFTQDLSWCVYVAGAFTLITAALIHSQLGSGPERQWPVAFRLSLGLCAQAVPLVLLLFLFFPRVYGGFRFQLGKSSLGISGMSEQMTPGSISSLAVSQENAFYVEFPDGDMPSLANLYWRGGVLWHGNGLTWERGSQRMEDRRVRHLRGPVIRQTIVLEPHGGKWLFALDRPAGEVRDASYSSGGFLQSHRPIYRRYKYQVISRPENIEKVLLPHVREQALQKPENVSTAVQELVASWRTDGANDSQVIERALRFFRSQAFVYTLEPGTYAAPSLDEFLFRRRKGFCEHFAAAYATLMRVAGIPSRVVVGYQGGQYNAMGNYVMVRQADVHAWCEVYLDKTGWLRVDPTTYVAPARVLTGLQSFLGSQSQQDGDGGAGSDASNRMLGFQELMREMKLAWDMLDYQWSLRVLNFDSDTQRSFFALVGLQTLSHLSLVVWVAIVMVLMIGVIGIVMKHGVRTSVDEVQHLYRKFCHTLGKRGARREVWEGPLDFTRRAAALFPNQAGPIRTFNDLYIASRYSAVAKDETPVPRMRMALRALSAAFAVDAHPVAPKSRRDGRTPPAADKFGSGGQGSS